MLARDWYYNDRRHVGLDFSAEAQVAKPSASRPVQRTERKPGNGAATTKRGLAML